MITLSHLSKSFGSLVAVNDLSLEINSGEILGFLGPNGAGKTTTIKMICGLLQPDSGSIHFDGQPEPLSSLIGLCTQENIYWPRLTCSEQLQFSGRIHGLSTRQSQERSNHLLARLGLTPKAQVLADNLSGGMKRRLNIALALIHDPPVLILDEPETGLDPQSRILVRDLIRELSQNKTVVLTTHNMDEAERLAGRVAIIDRGQVLQVKPVKALKKTLGEGDLLELILDQPPEALNQKRLSQDLGIPLSAIQLIDNKLLIHINGLLDQLPQLLDRAKGSGLHFKHVSMRETTLEDVFIHLTGKGLRE